MNLFYCYSQEVFGPVAPVLKFKTEEEAIQIANDTNAGFYHKKLYIMLLLL